MCWEGGRWVWDLHCSCRQETEILEASERIAGSEMTEELAASQLTTGKNPHILQFFIEPK